MPILDKPPGYQSYLLRCWEERSSHPDQLGQWRFSLEDPRTGRRRGFRNLDKLTSYLQTVTDKNLDKELTQ